MKRKSSSSERQECCAPHLTRNQRAVLDTLSQQANPVSAQQLYALLRQQREIGLATVYRALEILKLNGLLRSRLGSKGEALYSLAASHCHYLTCLHCGQSFPLNYCPVSESEAIARSSISFKIYYHTLDFFGLCELCAHQSSNEQ